VAAGAMSALADLKIADVPAFVVVIDRLRRLGFGDNFSPVSDEIDQSTSGDGRDGSTRRDGGRVGLSGEISKLPQI
jgi:hypothetical protein